MTFTKTNTIPAHQHNNPNHTAASDAETISTLLNKPLPQNNAAFTQQVINSIGTDLPNYLEDYRAAVLNADPKAAEQALIDYYTTTQLKHLAGSTPANDEILAEMDEKDNAAQKQFVHENLDDLHALFNQTATRFTELWELFKPTKLLRKNIEASAKLKKLAPELISTAKTLSQIKAIAEKYDPVNSNSYAHPLLLNAAFPSTYRNPAGNETAHYERTNYFDLENSKLQTIYNDAAEWARLLATPSKAGSAVILKWTSPKERQEQHDQYQKLIEDLNLNKGNLQGHKIFDYSGKELDIYRYWEKHPTAS